LQISYALVIDLLNLNRLIKVSVICVGRDSAKSIQQFNVSANKQ